MGLVTQGLLHGRPFEDLQVDAVLCAYKSTMISVDGLNLGLDPLEVMAMRTVSAPRAERVLASAAHVSEAADHEVRSDARKPSGPRVSTPTTQRHSAVAMNDWLGARSKRHGVAP